LDPIKSINDSCFPHPTGMENTSATPARSLPKVKFRVLIIGRANAGKTSILQRVCDTTDSPIIYQNSARPQPRNPVWSIWLILFPMRANLVTQIQLEPSMEVGSTRISLRQFLILELAWRAQHRG
jgi:hypothetical protein